jgi:4-hydroxysphinganine ceramide fatty acyl 2-hydroxylase
MYFISKNSLLYKLFTTDINNYKQMIHSPIILKKTDDSPIIINNGLLEIFTKSYYWTIPVVWGPVVLYYLYLSLLEVNLSNTLYFSSIGLFSWTLLEYIIHRCFFHMDEFMPHNKLFIYVHFIFHGIHHIIPNDKNRLVMPPLMSIFIFNCINPLINLIPITYGSLYAFKSGICLGYIGYDLTHYYLHHGNPSSNSYLGRLKKHHMNHHYKNHYSKFGLTSPFWDYVFKTM